MNSRNESFSADPHDRSTILVKDIPREEASCWVERWVPRCCQGLWNSNIHNTSILTAWSKVFNESRTGNRFRGKTCRGGLAFLEGRFAVQRRWRFRKWRLTEDIKVVIAWYSHDTLRISRNWDFSVPLISVWPHAPVDTRRVLDLRTASQI